MEEQLWRLFEPQATHPSALGFAARFRKLQLKQEIVNINIRYDQKRLGSIKQAYAGEKTYSIFF